MENFRASQPLSWASMAIEMTHQAGPFSYEDLEGMPDDGYRREIIGGSLVVTPAPSRAHQRVTGNVHAAAAGETSGTMAMVAPFDWRLPDGGSVQPDVMVIRREDFDPAGPLPASAVPLLVVEVLSPSNPAQDRMLKRDLYQRLGVPAYWIVDPLQPSLLALRRAQGPFEVETDTSATFRTDWPFPVNLIVAELVKSVRPTDPPATLG